MAVKFGPTTAGSSDTLFSFDPGNKRSFYNVENMLSGTAAFSSWGGNNSPVVTLNAGTAPDGSNTGIRFTGNTGGQGYYSFNTLVANRTYTYSIYVKPLSGTGTIQFGSDNIAALVNYNLVTRVATINAGSPTNITVTSVGNGWDRVSFRFQDSTGGSMRSNVIYYNGGGTASYLVWGYKLELGEGPTDYVYTSDQIIRSTSAISALGNQMRGTLVNGVSYSNNNGGTLLFDGVDDHMTFNINPPFRNAATIELWIKSANANSNWILGREGNYRITQNGGTLGTVMATVNNGWYTTGTPVDPTGQTFTNWNHIVFTYDGSFNRCYVNGSLAGSNTSEISGLVRSDGGAFEFAKPNAAGFGYWAGYLGPLNIYGRALTGTEIAANFNNLRGRFGI